MLYSTSKFKRAIMTISGTQLEDIFTIGIGLFSAIAGGTSTKFYPYHSSSNAKPLDIPIWLGRSLFILVGLSFVTMAMLDLSGVIDVHHK
jgi:hypothetical protein